MASLTWWAWVWVNSGSWWWTGRPGVLWFMGLQRVRYDWATELNWTEQHFQVDNIITIITLLLSSPCPFYLQGNWSTKKWNNLCKAWEWVSVRDRLLIMRQGSCSSVSSAFLPQFYPPFRVGSNPCFSVEACLSGSVCLWTSGVSFAFITLWVFIIWDHWTSFHLEVKGD